MTAPRPAPALTLTGTLALTLVLTLLFASGCNRTPRGLAWGTLVIDCDVAAAQLFVDDYYLGSVARLGRKPVRVPSGERRIEIRAEGYFAFYADVRVAAHQTQHLRVKLRAEPF